MLNVAGLAAIAQQKVGADDAGTRDWLNPVDYLKQVLLVQEWGPSPQRGWNFPAWSLSMEWLAYLIFPLLVLVLFRLRDRLPTRWLLVHGWPYWCRCCGTAPRTPATRTTSPGGARPSGSSPSSPPARSRT